jgi:DNA polymerase III subunit beta
VEEVAMKIRVERDTFAEASAWVLRSVGTRATLPVLGGVLIVADKDGKIRLAGTDLEVGAEAVVEGGIDADGQSVLPGRVLGEIARSLPPGTVRIEAEGGQARITCGSAEFTLRTLPTEDFPSLAAPQDAPSATVPAGEFATAVAQVTKAASRDEARPILTGVLLEADGSKLTFAATDSYRLAVRDIAWKGPKDAIRRVVPARALAEASRAAEAEGDVSIVLGESQVTVEGKDRRLTTRLIEGEFPNWRQLVPEDQPNRLTVDRETFLESVRRVGILAQQGTPVRLELGPAGVRLTAGTQDVGEAADLVEGKYEGEPLVIAFNPTYLSDGVQAIEGSEVVLSCRDGLKPAVLRSPDGGSFLYLLMPVRIS